MEEPSENLLFLRFPNTPAYTFLPHLKQNFSWKEFNVEQDNVTWKANPSKLLDNTNIGLYWVLGAASLILVRKLMESKVLYPLGKWLGIKSGIQSVDQIPVRISTATIKLEAAYASSNSKKFAHHQLSELSLVTALGVREIERWLRKRRTMDRPSTLVKFSESGWRFICYMISTSLGLATLWNKPWALDPSTIWEGHPHHGISNEIWWYFFYGVSLYVSLLTTHSFDVKRKDYWEMFLHHVITIGLLGLSWTHNVTRMGAYTLLLHDCADIFLEAAKMANYAKKNDLATGVFGVFTLVWIATRLVLYPKQILFTIWPASSPYYPARVRYFFLSLLVLLMGLHIFWTYFILKVAIAAITVDPEKLKDARSSDESESNEEAEADNRKLSTEIPLLRHYSDMAKKRFSLQEDVSIILSRIEMRKRMVMRRISAEIM